MEITLFCFHPIAISFVHLCARIAVCADNGRSPSHTQTGTQKHTVFVCLMGLGASSLRVSLEIEPPWAQGTLTLVKPQVDHSCSDPLGSPVTLLKEWLTCG